MKSLKRMLTVLLTIAVVLIAIFLAGRYGWKLGGFGACQGAGITSVEVSETAELWRTKTMKGKRMSSRIMNPFSMLCFGLAIGAAARLLDIFTTNLGEVFSQMAVWILMGTLISIYSRTAKHAMVNVLAFCLGMLVTYYFAAALSHGVYSMEFIIGWTVFALCSPVMAYFAWLTKERGIFAKIVGVGIVAVSILSSILLFDRLRIYDFLIDGILIYFLFFKKVNR